MLKKYKCQLKAFNLKEGESLEELDYALDLKADFTYEGEKNQTLSNIDGVVKKGKCIVICGSSGCGKTTLLRSINQLIPKFYEGKLIGQCLINGVDTKNLSIGETGQLVSSVFQDPRSQFFTLDSSLEIAFGLENFGVSSKDIKRKVDKAFELFGLQHLKDRNVFSLSSGERQLIAILASWVVDTDIFLMDEPTANLDYQSILKFKSLLSNLKVQGKTLIISEHRLYYLSEIADEYWYMENGEIKEKYTAKEFLELQPTIRKNMGLRATSIVDLTKCGNIREPHGFEFIAENIVFSYKKSNRVILNNFSLKVKQGEVLGIIGKNGCGKTSFGKLAAGLYKPQSGCFYFNNEKLSAKTLREKSIFIMQEAEFQFFTNSVLNELYYGRNYNENDKEKINELLKKFDMWKCRNRHPFSLSGGQMQKLVLMIAYLSPKPIVVLDEPTAGLDYKSLIQCSELIKKMQESKIVIVITHDLELISEVCTKCVSIENGNISDCFNFNDGKEFNKLEAYMENMHEGAITNKESKKDNAKYKLLDPRTKLLICILAMIAGIGADLKLIFFNFAMVMLVYTYEQRWKTLISGIFLMGGICFSYFISPSVITAFLISFFPRVILIIYGVFMISSNKDASRTITALRKLHISEKIIMVISVTFRFFPVLNKDLIIMSQSIKTRGFFPNLISKIKGIPEYIEIMIVPMVFRVIRIAEALSASAETRGISLRNKRESYIELKINNIDIFIMCLAVIMFATGIIV